MTRKKHPTPPTTTHAPHKPAGKPESQSHHGVQPRTARSLAYGAGFMLLFLLIWLVYGPVLECTEQYSYVSANPDTMHYVASQPLGHIYWAGRWMLLVCKWAPLGAAVFAGLFTLTAWLADYALRMPARWAGIGFIIPLAEWGWVAWRGTSIYFKSEPSLLMLIPAATLLAVALLAALAWAVRKATKQTAPAAQAARRAVPIGCIVMAALSIGTAWAIGHFNENVILTARLKNLMWEQDWDTMIEEARGSSRPTRSVAAYHAIALQQTGQLLDGMYDLAYDFPKLNLEQRGGSDEYALFTADCNFYAGLTYGAYRTAMDHIVQDGPSLYFFKRMALCALLNGEDELCRKYLALIKKNPFENRFAEKYSAMVGHTDRIDADPELKGVIALLPQDSTTEQNYRRPLFLGYNAGLRSGTDASLLTSAAACLYSKDLPAFMVRAEIMRAKNMRFPACMQQAIAILALKDNSLLKQYPQVGRFVPDEVRAFLLDAKPYVKDRLALRHELKERWLGSYVYYYYTENNDPDQVVQPQTGEKAGVN